MYINTKHIQILKTIKKNQASNLKDISDIFSLSNQHAKLYLEDIFFELFQQPVKNLKSEIIIDKIKNFPNTKNILRKQQQFTKRQKIFYLIFRLVKDKHVKLSYICQDLDLTKRNLNNYLDEVLNILSYFNLKIKVSNKGVLFIGSHYSTLRFKYLLIYKFLVEKDFLPMKIRTELTNFIKTDNFYQLRQDIPKFLKIIDCDFISHSEISLFSFYSTYSDCSGKRKIVADLSIEESIKYKPVHYDSQFFYTIFNFLKNSSFKNIPTIFLSNLFSLIDIFKCSKNDFDISVYNKSTEIRKIFAKYLGNHIYDDPKFFHIVNPWVNYSLLKNLFSIDDPTFLNLNLNYFASSNIYEMTREINEYLPHFTLFESIFIWYYFCKNESNELKNIFVFKDIPTLIVPILTNEIYKKHNVKIFDSVNIKNFNEYKKNNPVDNIITIENLIIYNNNLPIKNLYFPIPNYKRVVPTQKKDQIPLGI